MGEPEQSTLAELIGELPEELRARALTHATWTDDRSESYERLAYLGDSVLALAVASDLIERYPTVAAGGLTKIHNQAVSGVSCAEVGLELGVPAMLEAAQPEVELAIPAEVLLGGARALPEVTEALIGACFLAFGYERAAAAVVAAFDGQIEAATDSPADSKSALQELLAQRHAAVSLRGDRGIGPGPRAHLRSCGYGRLRADRDRSGAQQEGRGAGCRAGGSGPHPGSKLGSERQPCI